ncbi:MAG: esterase-like activity of phytase family protein [Pacificimonas sp.]
MLKIFFLLAGFALLGLSACVTTATGLSTPDGPLAIEAQQVPLNLDDPAQQQVGQLIYRGGLHLTSASGRFGGISGLRWNEARGQLLAITDAGDWLWLTPTEKDGRLIGIASAELGALPTASGAGHDKGARDAEAVTAFGSNLYAVAFERNHRVEAFDFSAGAPVNVAVPPTLQFGADWFALQEDNGGTEAMVLAEAGRQPMGIALSERAQNSGGHARAVTRLVEADGSIRSANETIAIADPFSPTDMDVASDGRILVVARSFSPLEGVAAEIHLLRDLSRDGDTDRLAVLRPPLSVDNFEGLAVREEGGRTMLYLVSDDNFSGLQRTLLLKFELP